MNRRRQRFLAAGLLIAVLPCGCQKGEDEEVRTYSVPKADAVFKANNVKPKRGQMPQDEIHGFGPKTPAKTAKTANAVRYRMIAAIVPVGRQNLFFKLLGPDSLLKTTTVEFAEFVKSLKITQGEPSWTLPKGWRQLPDDSPRNRGFVPRVATILVNPALEALELTVTRLPAGSRGQEADILQNVNRWRGQLGLENLEADNLYTKPDNTEATQEVRKLIINGQTVVLVSLVGNLKPRQPGAPPFAR